MRQDNTQHTKRYSNHCLLCRCGLELVFRDPRQITLSVVHGFVQGDGVLERGKIDTRRDYDGRRFVLSVSFLKYVDLLSPPQGHRVAEAVADH